MSKRTAQQLKDLYSFAVLAHGNQKYGDDPYSVHLDEVAHKAITMFASDPLFTAMQLGVVAWFHDVLEDTAESFASLIEAGLSVEEVYAVDAITKRDWLSYEEYIEQVRANPLALKVKIADTLCNLTHSLMEGNNKRIMKYTKQLQLLSE